MTEPLDRIPFYRRPRRPPKRRRLFFVKGKLRGSFVAEGFLPGFGGRRQRPERPVNLLEEGARARGVPVFDQDAGFAELGSYLGHRGD